MKKTSTLIALLAILFSGFNAIAEGEDDDDRRRRRKGGGFGIHANLAPVAFGTYSLNLEYYLSSEMSIVTTVGYSNLSVESPGFDSTGMPVTIDRGFSGFIIAPEFRYYFDPSRRPGNDGWFAGGYFKYRNYSTNGEVYTSFDIDGDLVSYDLINNGISAGITFGRVWSTKSGFMFSSWSGIGYFLYNNEKRSKDFQEDPFFASISNTSSNLPALDFRLGISVGYRF